MNMYDVIYEAICDQYENGEITLEEAEILNDTAYDKYVVEKKTKADYRLQKFKKKYDYDPKTGTIDMHGHKVKFNYEDSGKKYNKSVKGEMRATAYQGYGIDDEDASITLNRAAFNQKHPKTHEFIAGHEIGHIDAHNMKERKHDLYKSQDRKYRGFLNNQIKKGKFVTPHSNNPDEYIADHMASIRLGYDTARKAMKDMKKSNSNPNIKDIRKENKEQYEQAKVISKKCLDVVNDCNNKLKSGKLSPSETKQVKDYRDDIMRRYTEIQKLTTPEGILKDNKYSNRDTAYLRMRSLRGNEKLRIKDKLRDPKNTKIKIK